MIEGLLDYLVKNRQDAGLVGYMAVTIIFMGLAFQKEWLILGKVYKREIAGFEARAKTLDSVTEKLTDQRILNERAAVTIEMLQAQVRNLELDIARAEGRKAGQERQRAR